MHLRVRLLLLIYNVLVYHLIGCRNVTRVRNISRASFGARLSHNLNNTDSLILTQYVHVVICACVCCTVVGMIIAMLLYHIRHYLIHKLRLYFNHMDT